MTEFEFVFSIFSLLLGFSLVHVLGGLARVLETRLTHAQGTRQMKVGLLTPMLGIFVMLNLLSFWASAWSVRDLLHINRLTLLAVMSFSSVYYIAAHLVFPREITDQTDLDSHFFSVRRIVFAIILIPILTELGFYASQPELLAKLQGVVGWAFTIILIVLILAAMFFKRKSVLTAVMAALIVRYLIIYAL